METLKPASHAEKMHKNSDRREKPFYPEEYRNTLQGFLTAEYPDFWNFRSELQNTLATLPLVKRAALLSGLVDEKEQLINTGKTFDTDRKRQIDVMLNLGIRNVHRPLIPKEKKDANIQKLLDQPVFDNDLNVLKLRWSTHLERYKKDIENLQLIGLAPEVMLKAWEQSGYVIYENLEAIQKLESLRPGSVSYLAQEFGLRDFARYPISLLTEQFDEAENTNLPYGIIVNPYFDNYTSAQGHMRAFYEDKDALSDFHKSLQRRHLLRVIEVGGLIGIGKEITKLERKYGKKQKISFAIVGAHGSWDSMIFGEQKHKGKTHHITIKTLQDAPEELGIKKAFVDNPTIILNSCEVGQENAIAQVISSKMQATVLAPEHKAESMELIESHYKDSPHVSFSVRFKGSEIIEYRNGTKVTWDA